VFGVWCSNLRLIDSCITQPKAQGPAGTCNESKEETQNTELPLTIFGDNLGSVTPRPKP